MVVVIITETHRLTGILVVDVDYLPSESLKILSVVVLQKLLYAVLQSFVSRTVAPLELSQNILDARLSQLKWSELNNS